MKALLIDAGNSRVTCAAWQGEHQLPGLVGDDPEKLAPAVQLEELGFLALPAGEQEEEIFRAALRRILKESGHPPVVLVSVIPALVSQVAQVLPDPDSLVVIDHTCELPFVLDVAEPGQVGPDRLCNVAAAAAAGLASALVVDAGTATTFDLLIEGHFIGGMIAPGMAFAARQLGEFAARLEAVPFGPVSWDAGRDTRAAMAGGAWHAGCGGVRAVVAGLRARYGNIPVVVTGGLGCFLEEPGWYHDPHWTLRGAAFLSKTPG